MRLLEAGNCTALRSNCFHAILPCLGTGYNQLPAPLIYAPIEDHRGQEPWNRSTAFRSPWQNGVAGWVGSCRRDLLDHVIVLNERHLKRLMREYIRYYHGDRTHLGLAKDTPQGRPVARDSADGKQDSIVRSTGWPASSLRPGSIKRFFLLATCGTAVVCMPGFPFPIT